MYKNLMSVGVAAAVVLLVGLALSWYESATAADHGDAPLVSNDQGADIADVFAFHDMGAGTFTTILTYGSGAAPLPLYDADVLYTIHIDTNADNTAEHQIEVRFGVNGAGEFGVQALNVPGNTAPLSGPVDTVITGAGGVKLFAGMVDDPFFFDQQGFTDTLATRTLAFDNSRDAFAGRNVMAFAVEMPISLGGANNPAQMKVWATTGRE
jgi:hypothetical protein